MSSTFGRQNNVLHIWHVKAFPHFDHVLLTKHLPEAIIHDAVTQLGVIVTSDDLITELVCDKVPMAVCMQEAGNPTRNQHQQEGRDISRSSCHAYRRFCVKEH